MNKIIKKSPRHIGIIIDGNRRWAKKRGLPALEGHRRGFENVKEMIKWCTARELNILTFYAFSTENWNRSQREVNYLMRLLLKAMNKKYVKKVEKEKIGIRLMGQRERLPKFLQKSIKDAEELTKERILSKDTLLVDVRHAIERRFIPPVPGAKIWSPYRFDKLVGELPRDREIIFMCNTGSYSMTAAYKLAMAGHERARVVAGGYQAWVAAHPKVTEQLKKKGM